MKPVVPKPQRCAIYTRKSTSTISISVTRPVLRLHSFKRFGTMLHAKAIDGPPRRKHEGRKWAPASRKNYVSETRVCLFKAAIEMYIRVVHTVNISGSEPNDFAGVMT